MKIILACFALLSCSHKSKGEPVTASEQVKQELTQAREFILPWAEVCIGAATKENCDDGDSMLWNGLLCLSGEAQQCAAMNASQSADGRLWRSPRRVNNDDANSFSRDMTMGFLAGQSASFSADVWNKATAYLNETKRLCPGDTSHCGITPMLYALWNQTAKAKGGAKLNANTIMQPATNAIVGPKVPSADDLVLLASAKGAQKGYPLHLVGVHLLVRKQLGDWNLALDSAAKALAKREPQNLFFAHLNNQQVGVRLISAIPKMKPEQRTQWSFERTDAENASAQTMVWEFVFLINLLLKS